MICLDANCLIYLIEGNPIWNQKIVARLVRAKAIGDTVGVCDLVRAECLIGPLKNRSQSGFGRLSTGFFQSHCANVACHASRLRTSRRDPCGFRDED